jgi:hypothetical protein
MDASPIPVSMRNARQNRTVAQRELVVSPDAKNVRVYPRINRRLFILRFKNG